MISVICACNNEKIYSEMLLPSILKQTEKDYEVIKLNAAELGLKGAANTLNYGVKKAKGDLLLFVHQDVELLSDTFFEEVIKYSRENDFSIAGVAGVIKMGKKEKRVYSSVVMDVNRVQAGIKNTAVRNVESVDECLFIIKKDNFKGFKDYGTWHFYAVEYSLRARASGGKAVIFPLEIYHFSPGWSFDASYWQTLKAVERDFSKLKYIPTTVACFPNNKFWWFKQWVKKRIELFKKRRQRLKK